MTTSLDPVGDALEALGWAGEHTPVERLQSVAAAYRAARAAWVSNWPKDKRGRPQTSLAVRAWIERVWRTPQWASFVQARRKHDPTDDIISWEFFAFRNALLAAMGALSSESTPKEVSRVTGTYRLYASEYAWTCVRFGRPGQAMKHMKSLYKETAWENYQRLRTKQTKSLPKYKERQREAAKKRYVASTKAYRATPEVRQRLNAQRRARYARAKEAIEMDALRDQVTIEEHDQEERDDSIL